MANYSDLLRDPRWQRKRLEVLNRDNFTCIICGDDKNELQIHHLYYDGRNPWEYELDALETLCRKCHEKNHFGEKITESDRSEITELRAKISIMRKLIPNTWYPNTGWIEERLDKMTAELNKKLNGY